MKESMPAEEKPMGLPYFLVFAAMITATVSAQTTQKALPSLGAEFQRLDKEQRVEVVLAALRTRDAQLDNFLCEFSETWENVRPAEGKRSPVRRIVGLLGRLDERTLLRTKVYMLGSKEVETECVSTWNGSLQRTLTKDKSAAISAGTIRDVEIELMRGFFCTQMLGFRVPEASMTLPQWLSKQIGTLKRPVDAFVEVADGKELISLKVQSGPNYHDQYWLDPARGFMLVRYKYLNEFQAGSTSAVSEVQEARELDGVWVPLKVVRTMKRSGKPNDSEMIYEISHFKRGLMTDADFVVDFPVGSMVVDSVDRVVYRVLPNGGREYKPFFEAATGKIIQPTTRPAVGAPTSRPVN